MAITTAEVFLDVLQKSGLLTTEQFAEAQDATLLTSNAAELADVLVRQGVLTAWQVGQLLAGRSALFLGNYSLMDLLGRGGMGSVFLAKHKTMKRQVALKVVSKNVGRDPASLERFLAEARSIAALDHPNIVRAYDVDKESDRFYIVMEYVEGQDLDEIVRQHGLFDYEEVADCIRQAADGLAHAHSRNMIHCDIKPSNLLLSDQGTIKILDMGMARLIGGEEDSSEQHEHKVLGTVDYMAPEQAMEGPDFDHRADIYSLGCTLYFLLTGRPPFDEGTITQRIVKHQTQPPPDILQLQPETPRGLVDICNKMMAKNPADRYQSAEDVSRTLAEWQAKRRSEEDTKEEAVDTEQSIPPTEQVEESRPTREVASLAIEELPPASQTVDGQSLDSKVRKGGWSEEQQTVVLVAAAVFFAIIVLSIALLIMIFRGDPAASPAIATYREQSSERIINQKPTLDATQKPTVANDMNKSSTAKPTARNDAETNNKEEKPDKKTPLVVPELSKVPSEKQVRPKQDSGDSANRTKQPPNVAQSPTAETTSKDARNATRSRPKDGKIQVSKDKPKRHPDKHFRKHPRKSEPKDVKPKVNEPFADVPPAVDLQLLQPGVRRLAGEQDQPFKLATLPTKSGSMMTMMLVGGDVALAGKARFVLSPVENTNTELSWLIRLEKATSTDVARIRYAQGDLVFEWLAGADAEEANHLKNCALDITLNDKTHTMALTRPQTVGPLMPDVLVGTSSLTLSDAYLPAADSLRLEITALDFEAAGIELEPKVVLKIGQHTDIKLNVQNVGDLFARVTYSIADGATRVTLECFCKHSGNDYPVRLKNSEWKNLDRAGTGLRKNIEKWTAELQRKKRLSPLKQKQLETVAERLKEVEMLFEFGEAINEKGKVFFREYVEDGERLIELSNSDVPKTQKKKSR